MRKMKAVRPVDAFTVHFSLKQECGTKATKETRSNTTRTTYFSNASLASFVNGSFHPKDQYKVYSFTTIFQKTSEGQMCLRIILFFFPLKHHPACSKQPDLMVTATPVISDNSTSDTEVTTILRSWGCPLPTPTQTLGLRIVG